MSFALRRDRDQIQIHTMSLQLSSKKKKAAGGRKRAPIAAAKKAPPAPVAKKPEVIEEKKVEPVSLCVYPKSVFCMLRP